MYYQCTSCQKLLHNPPTPVWLCGCGKPLSVHYEWEGVPRDIRIEQEEESLWRYTSVLPPNSKKEKTSLGEGWTPLIPIGNNLYIKNETVNPTGSFKDRGMAIAITMAKIQNNQSLPLGNRQKRIRRHCPRRVNKFFQHSEPWPSLPP